MPQDIPGERKFRPFGSCITCTCSFTGLGTSVPRGRIPQILPAWIYQGAGARGRRETRLSYPLFLSQFAEQANVEHPARDCYGAHRESPEIADYAKDRHKHYLEGQYEHGFGDEHD
jgi:hypothetical protein